jgi:sulfur-oxidizing protein SoxB
MAQTAITYPYTTVTDMSGEDLDTLLEALADNLFDPDPYYQQGGDMVRVGGLTYSCAPNAMKGNRIGDLRLDGKPIEPARKYRVAGWAPVAQTGRGEPVWDVVETYLKARRSIAPPRVNLPRLVGVENNPGVTGL